MKTIDYIPSPVIFELNDLIHRHGHLWREPILRHRLSKADHPELKGYCEAFGTGWIAQLTQGEIIKAAGQRLVIMAKGI